MDRRRVLLVAAVLVAVLGTGMVFLYAQSAESRAADKFDLVEVLVATGEIEPGEAAADAARDNKITVAQVPAASELAGATADGNDFRDTFALTTIYPGEQLIADKFGAAEDVEAAQTLPTPDGLIAVSLQLDDPERVAGFARPGSRAAVFATTTDRTFAVSANVLILGTGSATQIGQPSPVDSGDEADAEEIPQTLLTIAVTQAQAERTLYWAQNAESVSFALMQASDDVTVDEDAARPPGATLTGLPGA